MILRGLQGHQFRKLRGVWFDRWSWVPSWFWGVSHHTVETPRSLGDLTHTRSIDTQFYIKKVRRQDVIILTSCFSWNSGVGPIFRGLMSHIPCDAHLKYFLRKTEARELVQDTVIKVEKKKQKNKKKSINWLGSLFQNQEHFSHLEKYILSSSLEQIHPPPYTHRERNEMKFVENTMLGSEERKSNAF